MNLTVLFQHPLLIDLCLVVVALWTAFLFTGVKANILEILLFGVFFLMARFIVSSYLMAFWSYGSALIYFLLIFWFLARHSSVDHMWEGLFAFAFCVLFLIGVAFLSEAGPLVFFGLR